MHSASVLVDLVLLVRVEHHFVIDDVVVAVLPGRQVRLACEDAAVVRLLLHEQRVLPAVPVAHHQNLPRARRRDAELDRGGDGAKVVGALTRVHRLLMQRCQPIAVDHILVLVCARLQREHHAKRAAVLEAVQLDALSPVVEASPDRHLFAAQVSRPMEARVDDVVAVRRVGALSGAAPCQAHRRTAHAIWFRHRSHLAVGDARDDAAAAAQRRAVQRVRQAAQRRSLQARLLLLLMPLRPRAHRQRGAEHNVRCC
mmetsp:Transcript_31780/g.94837  ORF Transcript_31780/g.94837 Transcript_31780/m.94837 type:complete len:256 (-) Transcript_31780:649-1416(-)